MKLLLHTCCAPCSVYCIDSLRKEGIEPILYWYNPNIHPYIEYKERMDCLKNYANKINVKAIFEDEYGLDNFCKNVSQNINSRCVNYCYPIRLRKAFEYAKENGYDAVSTTLLYSIYQKHEAIKKIMTDLSVEFGIEFLYRDFRIGYWEGHEKAIEAGLYMQKYCGCVFSEEDRYLGTNKTKMQLPEGFEFNKRKPLEIKRILDKENYIDFINENKISNLDNIDIYGLKRNDEIISVAVIEYKSNEEIELLNIETKSEYRNKGYAKRLIKALFGNYKQKYFEFLVGATGEFLPFFVKQGFDVFERQENEKMYYSKKLKESRKI